MENHSFKVEGMSCDPCVMALHRQWKWFSNDKTCKNYRQIFLAYDIIKNKSHKNSNLNILCVSLGVWPSEKNRESGENPERYRRCMRFISDAR